MAVKQTVGDTYSGPLEVGKPVGYSGPIDMQAFREAVETYYRKCVHAPGDTSRMNIKMTNNTFDIPSEVVIPQPVTNAEGW